jgi:sugar O-acyltransferase (sialic acid O-acetyltransferase NeuD family)
MIRKNLLIVGAGGHGRSVAESAMTGGEFEVVGFLDDDAASPKEVLGIAVLGNTRDPGSFRACADSAIVAIGDNSLRQALMEKLEQAGFELVTLIHPRASVSPRASLGVGCSIMAGAIVGTEARLGRGVVVNSGAVVDHHAEVGDYGHIGVNACMAGGATLGRSAWIQAGCALGYGVKVAPGSVLPPGTSVP